MSIGARIKKHLKENGIKQKALCKQTGISESRLSCVLSDKRKLNFDDYAKIIAALNVPVGTFIEPINAEELDEEEA